MSVLLSPQHHVLVRVVVGLLAAIMSMTTTSAEVSVAASDFGLPPTISIVGIIVDDPDPIFGYWQTFRPNSPFRRILNPNGAANGDGPPSVTRHPITGMPLVAWAKNNAGDRDVVLSTFDGGDWTGAATVVGGAGDQLDPSIAVDPISGDVHVVYWVEGASPKVMRTHAPSDLGSWSTPQQISAPGEIALRPTAEWHAGALRVAYEVHDSGRDVTPRRIELATVVQTTVAREVVAYSQHADQHLTQIHTSSDRFWIDWVDGPGQMGWRRCVVGAWDGVGLESFTGIEEQEFQVRELISHQAID